MHEFLKFDVTDKGVATVTLNRPDRMNSLNAALKGELSSALAEIENSKDIRVVIVTGAGSKAFCAGRDIKEANSGSTTSSEFYLEQKKTVELFSKLEKCPRPTIAAINGVALGGGAEIALCCDIRLLSTRAKFGLPEVKLGVIPAGGGTQRLPRLVGAAKAKELMFLCETLDAEECVQQGIGSRVLAEEGFMDLVMQVADRIAAMPPLAVQAIKRCVDNGLHTDIQSGLEYELLSASILFDTEDREEGMTAFLEKRTPVYSGR